MKKLVLDNIRAWSIGMAIYQILGGVAMLLVFYFNITNPSLGALFYLAPIIGLCLVSIMAGASYFVKNEFRFFLLSKINFYSQVLQFAVPGIGFSFYYGPYLGLGGDGGFNFRLSFELLTANFSIQFLSGDGFYLFVNLIPIVLIRALRWIERNPVPAELENAFEEEEIPQS